MTFNFAETSLKVFSIHKVGNKSADEGYVLSSAGMEVSQNLKELLTQYFVSSFKSVETYCFYHENDLKFNEVYGFVSEIFTNPATLHKHSENLATHLYEKSLHPKIKGGEFYVVYFTNCMIDEERFDAVGLFKSELKDTFLKVSQLDESFNIQSEKGVNINKLDKGCIVFNTEKETGFVSLVIDNSSKGEEAHYWIDEFLQLRQRKDEYYNTQSVMQMCKNFVTKELPQKFEVSKADQIAMLNRSVQFFKENDSFDLEDFSNEVVEQPEVIEAFRSFKNDFQREHDMDIAENFDISEQAVKKQARYIKSVIKLDKNFHIYVHGNREMIEQGIDESGRKFYKIYYKEES
ncbi:MAG: nucleoid-associated protein [Bacteroidetes bacterium]|nr:nucleoid-associated protein [Bacteroidota bacterium]